MAASTRATLSKRTEQNKAREAKTKRERDLEAVGGELEVPNAPEASAADKPTSTAAKAESPKAARSAGRPPRTVDVERVGVYLAPSHFHDAKAAYLADWLNGGEANTFSRWLGEALSLYSRQTAKQRKASAEAREPRSDAQQGKARSFVVRESDIMAMRQGIAEDQKAGRWPSVSQWCVEALEEAIEKAIERNGGELPEPPARLPNKLVR